MTDIEKRIRELLSEVYTPEGVEIWLTARNRNLNDNLPCALLSCCRDCAEVLLVEAERLSGVR